MAKKVNFYKIELHKKNGSADNIIEYTLIKDIVLDIIRQNAINLEKEKFSILDLTRDDGLHYNADIFEYSENTLFMRMSNQKPSGGFLKRNYVTNVPGAVGIEEKEGIEVYTYVLLNYETGILSIVNQQGAPAVRIINNIFSKYNPQYYFEFISIPNKTGIDKIYDAKKSKVSQIEVEVPVPNATYLQKMFGWKESEIIDTIQENKLKVVVRVSGAERKSITEDEEHSRKLIKTIRNNLNIYNKAKIRAKAEGIKTQDYNFFDENFSYLVEIPTYTVENQSKRYLSEKELIKVYEDNLKMAYNECLITLKAISNR